MRRGWDSFPLLPSAAPPPEDTVGAEQFKDVFRRHPAGVAVVALRVGGRPYGFTATSVVSVSLEPPLLAFSVATRSAAWRAIARTDGLVISFLSAGQADLAARFATPGIDRFRDVEWSSLPTGEPVLTGTTSWIRGDVLHQVRAGESHLVVVRALQAHTEPERAPLVYLNRRYHRG